MTRVTVGAGPISPDDVVVVARRDAEVLLDESALARIKTAREHIDALAESGEPVYGV